MILPLRNKLAAVVGLAIINLLVAVATFLLLRPAAPKTPPPVTVSAIHPIVEDLTVLLEVPGDLKPNQEIEILSLVSGYVQEMKVDIGDRVKAGDVIATLEVVDPEKQIQAFKGTKPSVGTLPRGSRITNIISPFDGTITKRNADPGTLVQMAAYSGTLSIPIASLAQDGLLRASFPVPETTLGKFRIGEEIGISIPILNRTTSGKLARFSNQVDSATRTMTVEVDIPNVDFSIISGLYAIGSFPLERAKGALTLPVQAIRTPDTPSVLVVSKDGVLEKRAVKIGVETATRVQIVSGVSDGETVVLGNSSELEPGMKVVPTFPQAPASSPAAN
jgi:multidrug efflux pump subunit AcrA (membrane-fusion protein)